MIGTQSRPLPLTGDLNFDREMLAASGLFDEDWYREQAGAAAASDPVRHYLTTGWRAGLEPNPAFPGAFFLPYFSSAGFDGPPAVTWLDFRAMGWPVYETRERLDQVSAAIRDCPWFDEEYYAGRAALAGLDPATHYVLVGERLGLAPSALFDPVYYADRYPDAAADNLLLHYARHGFAEQRRGVPAPVPECTRNAGRFDPAKQNVLLIINNASRTGAPILGWNIGVRLARAYNVFTILIGDGELKNDFAEISAELHGPCTDAGRWDNVNPTDFEYSLRHVLEGHSFRYAVVNSAESCTLIEPCIRRFIPTIFLIHEFAIYSGHFPLSNFLGEALDVSTEVVFPASIVARNSEEYFINLSKRRLQVRAQGLSLLPARAPLREDHVEALAALRRQVQEDGSFVVVGAGSIHFMKGVDIFLAIASAVKRAGSGRPVHFVWVGHGPAGEARYLDFLREQVKRSGLIGSVTFLDEMSDLEPVYQVADLFLLASRLDPLPNVSIDAAARGIPVVCFKGASGMSELLAGNAETAESVVEHLDTQAAADEIVGLANDEARFERLSSATRTFAERAFDMDSYVESLDRLGSQAAERVAQQKIDAELLLFDPTFDQDTFLGPGPFVESRRETIVRYLAIAGVRRVDQPQVQDWKIRRPAPGFNPNIYAIEHPKIAERVNPLADFLRKGKPQGAWQARLILPAEQGDSPPQRPQKLRVALQAHFFYPELAADLLARLRLNRTRCDLLVSTNDAEKARFLTRVLAGHDGSVDIRIVPNQGRDVAPLLTEFGDVLTEYDVIGHVHGKRSKWHDDENVGEIWREFLWQNLIGGRHAMLDRIMAAFEQDQTLGLVFPSDPHIIGWTENRTLAESLAKRMGIKEQLPHAFDFPVGTMFWMRRDAMKPLLSLHLDWADYPAEPIPIDGTILHALERLLPFAGAAMGFSFAETHVPGVMR